MSSLDLSFKRECFSLLGLPSPEYEKDIVEKCIKDKIISVVATNDSTSSSRGTKKAPALFDQGPEEECEGAGEYSDTELHFDDEMLRQAGGNDMHVDPHPDRTAIRRPVRHSKRSRMVRMGSSVT